MPSEKTITVSGKVAEGNLLEGFGVTTAATALMGTLNSNRKSLDIINSSAAVSPEIVSRLYQCRHRCPHRNLSFKQREPLQAPFYFQKPPRIQVLGPSGVLYLVTQIGLLIELCKHFGGVRINLKAPQAAPTLA